MDLVLVLGGVSSGKSAYAEARYIGQSRQSVVYLATAYVGEDEEMAERIARHQARRPRHWQLVEARERAIKQAAEVLPHHAVFLDGLGLALSWYLENGQERQWHEDIRSLMTREGSTLIVSDEVGLGLVSPYPMGRAFQETLGKTNQLLAQEADEAIFVVAGYPLWLKRPGDSVR